MADRESYLVVGGDSLVGGGLIKVLSRRGERFYSTTRRKETVTEERVYLDFEDEDSYKVPADVGYAFIVAAATNYERCEKDPVAYTTNVELTPRLIEWLLKQGIFVTFISTNSVFGGERPWPHEESEHAPGIAYAIQKDEAEKGVKKVVKKLGAEESLNIVRLTKILDKNTPPTPQWLAAWKRGEKVTPFSDLIFSPMSVRFVGEALATIGRKRVSGDLHLSGADNVSYVDFATALAKKLGVDESLLSPTTSTAVGVNIAFKPTYSGLGMERTTALTGIEPQKLADVITDLVEQTNNS
ncbi:MAG: sugar nucleotide-binding protein [Nitrospinota bacterium]|nr:sugar nucleotide-binding protein [Nitrospinota bacterium]